MAVILIVDDDDQCREMLKQALGRAGYEVLDAPDGKKAINILHAGPVDLIITDILMPEEDGLEIIREMRRDFPGLKIIAISGGGVMKAEDCLKMAASFGAHRTVKKPVHLEALLGTVKDVLGVSPVS